MAKQQEKLFPLPRSRNDGGGYVILWMKSSRPGAHWARLELRPVLKKLHPLAVFARSHPPDGSRESSSASSSSASSWAGFCIMHSWLWTSCRATALFHPSIGLSRGFRPRHSVVSAPTRFRSNRTWLVCFGSYVIFIPGFSIKDSS